MEQRSETMARRHGLLLALAAVGLLLGGPPARALPTGADVLRKLAEARAGIRDITVDVEVHVDMPNVQMPDLSVRVLHKAPDKTKLQPLKGFAVIPKGTLMVGDPLVALARESTITVLSRAVLGGRPVYHLRLAPTEGRRRRAADVWVDAERWVANRMRSLSPNGDPITVDFTYQRVQDRYWLPQRTVARLRMPAAAPMHPSGDPDAPAPPDTLGDAPGDPVPSTVTVTFRDYKLNTNLPDSLFREEAKSPLRPPHRRRH